VGFRGASYKEPVLRFSYSNPRCQPEARYLTAISPTPTPARLTQAAQGLVHRSPPLLELVSLLPRPVPRPRAPCALNETWHEQPQPGSVWGETDGKAGTSTHHGGVDLSQKPGVVLLDSLQALQHGRDVGVTEQEGSVWGEKTVVWGVPLTSVV